MVDCFFMHEKSEAADDAIPDVNIDHNGDGYADLNIDHDDGIPYKNLVILTEWKPNQDFTLKDGYYFETMTNLKVDENQI